MVVRFVAKASCYLHSELSFFCACAGVVLMMGFLCFCERIVAFTGGFGLWMGLMSEWHGGEGVGSLS